MFLALKEMTYSKLRYTLIIGIMFLISLVVFLLSGLANGLSTEFRQVIDQWDAKEIVLSEESNKVLAASQLSMEDLEFVSSNDKSPLGIYSSAIGDSSDKTNITFFGTTTDAFFLPEMTHGETFKKENEVVISQNLADKGYDIGDTITLGSEETPVKVVGIFPETSYVVTPVMYGSVKVVAELKFGKQMVAQNENFPINAILTNSTTNLDSDHLVGLSTQELIENLPGYSEQNLTLNAMIYFLFVIAAAVIAIFMYVITLQKTAIFGVMKVQGINTWFISKSIIAQSFLVGVFGVVLAAVVTYGLSFVFPAAMPFAIDIKQWLIYGVILIIVSIIGGLFSTITVNKVDPINAIGG